MKYILPTVILSMLISCGNGPTRTETVSDAETFYERYDLQTAHGLVIDAFKDADIVILGEHHFIAEHVIFVADIIPQLYNNGINTLYSEFIGLDDAHLVDSLINGETFDEQLAKNLLVLNLYDWPYEEYMELYRSAWKLNRSINEGPKFKIIGLDLGNDHSAIQKPEDWNDPERRMAFFREGEDAWSKRILNGTVANGEKALVYCGYNHALTYYRQPVSRDGKLVRLAGKERMGQHLYEELGDRCSFLFFHIPWENRNGDYPPSVAPLGGTLDMLIDSLPDKEKAYGFYTRESELGSIVDTSIHFSLGHPSFTLKDLCDGYLVVKPVCELNWCDFIPDFIDEDNIEMARPQIRAWKNIHNISIDSANVLIKNEYDEQLYLFEKSKEKMGC